MDNSIQANLEVIRFIGGMVPEASIVSNDRITIKRIHYGKDTLDCLLKIYHHADLTLQYRPLIQITRTQRNSGLAKVYDVAYLRGDTYVVEERVQGHTLREEMKNRYLLLSKDRIEAAYTVEEARARGIAFLGPSLHAAKAAGVISADTLFLPTEILFIAESICSALSTLHAHKIIHGDIRPENIMVEVDGSVKLIDYDNTTFYDYQN